jgi:hypothetical protein
VRVTDNGAGVREMTSMFSLGDSLSQHSLNDIGQFGVGAKHACIWMGSTVTVETVRHGASGNEAVKAAVDWKKALETGEWPYVNQKSVKVDQPTGTAIVVHDFWPHRPAINLPSLLSHLGRMYASALLDGRTITVWDRRNSTQLPYTVKPFIPEGLSDIVRFEVEDCKCEFGILSDKALRHLSGMHYYFGPRWITQHSDLAGSMLPTRIYGTVTLGDKWKSGLTQHKDDLVNRGALERAMEPYLRDLIATAREYEKDLSIDKLNTKLATLLGRRIRIAVEGEEPDTTVERLPPICKSPDPDPNPNPPVRKGGTRPGKYDLKGNPSGGIEIVQDPDPSDLRMAQVDIERRNIRIVLNTASPLVKQMFEANECARVGFSRAYAAFLGTLIAGEVARKCASDQSYAAVKRVLPVPRSMYIENDAYGTVSAWWSHEVTVDLFN